MTELRSPYPWFGGKRRVADVIWRAIGPDVPNFIDPFFGSNSILLARPNGPGKIETISDADRMVANFWRAIASAPFDVAAWCDGPVNEADLHSRHKWLVNQVEFRERMHADPDYFDAKIAGWWVWGLCQWIGGGWCVEPQNGKHPKLDGIGKGIHSNEGHRKRHEESGRPDLTNDHGVHAKRPHLAGTDKGVHQKRPHMTGDNAGHGIHALSQQLPSLRVTDGAAGNGIHASGQANAYSPGRRPRMSDAGNGVHLPSLGNDRGIFGVSAPQGTFLHTLQALVVPESPPAFEWFAQLAVRMRRVRVECGDWTRVLGNSVLGKGKNVGGRRPCAVVLDPPYGHDQRCPYLYSEESPDVAQAVADWAREHGDDPDLRIVLCGYDGEHAMPASWTVHRWKAARGYAGADNTNRARETLWLSPHCLPIDEQRTLFGEAAQ